MLCKQVKFHNKPLDFSCSAIIACATGAGARLSGKVGSHSASEHRASKRAIVPAVQGRRGRPLGGVCGWAPHNIAGREFV